MPRPSRRGSHALVTAEAIPVHAAPDVGLWRYVFLVKGWFNILASPVFAVAPLVSDDVEDWMRVSTDGALMYLYIFLAHAFCFGCIYVWISRDPLRHLAIVYLSIPIEISFMSIVLGNWAAGNIDFWLTLPGLQDGLMAVLFTAFLLRFRKVAR